MGHGQTPSWEVVKLSVIVESLRSVTAVGSLENWVQQIDPLSSMLKDTESIIVGFGGLTVSESAAIDERTTTKASAKKNRNLMNGDIKIPPSSIPNNNSR
jgi:hypothetical protein